MRCFKIPLWFGLPIGVFCVVLNANSVQVRDLSLAERFFDIYKSNMPVVLLVENTREAHEDAESFYADVESLRLNTVGVEFILSKFNDSGPTPILTSNLKNPSQFRKLLNWENSQQLFATSRLGLEFSKSTALFYSVLHAASILPPDSGILIFTDKSSDDEDFAQLALREVRKRRIRIFVVWGGLPPKFTNEAGIIREAVYYSNGAFFISPAKSLSEKLFRKYPEIIDDSKENMLVLFKQHQTGPQNFQITIDSQTTELHLSLSTTTHSALLITPTGRTLNILNATDVEHFSFGSFFTNATHANSYEIQLILDRRPEASDVGVWELRLKGVGFSAAVSVRSAISVDGITLDSFPGNGSSRLTAKVCGDVKKISKIRLLDAKGQVYRDDVMFSEQTRESEEITDVDIIETQPDKDVNIDSDTPPEKAFFVEIIGENSQGGEFQRLSYVDVNHQHFTLPPLTVEVGVGSELLAKPNQFARIFFEVTNNRDQTLFVRFRCHDDKSLLVGMQPLSSWLNPRQSVIVTVTTRTSSSTVGYNDLITFSVGGFDFVEKAVLMNVNQDKVVDYSEPTLTHKYTSDCMNVLLGSCEGGTWTIEATAQDTDSGLLQLGSEPKGLYFPNGYTAGTTEKVTGYYSGSCCQPKLQLIAVDRANNRRVYTADAYFATLSVGSIIAIVFGILLLLLIIVGLVLLCRTKCKCCNRTGSMDLPVYRGPSGRSARLD